VLLAGESLGSAVAAVAAEEAPREVAGLLLVTPLASVPAVGRRHYPFLPAWFFRDPWRADLALPRYGGPVAFLLAGDDEVTFADLGEALHDAYPGPKRLWVEPRAGHNGLDWDPRHPRWREMVELVAGASATSR
jgi:pimeloyl-ACP methyl ester carboxylesterase